MVDPKLGSVMSYIGCVECETPMQFGGLCNACANAGANIGELDQYEENTGDDIDYRPPEYYEGGN